MLEFLTSYDADDAIVLIKADHEKVKDLFDRYKDAKSTRDKRSIVAQTILELKLHAEVEEKLFYPMVRKEIGRDIMNEADEEHHVAKLLIAELEVLTGTEEHYDAKYKVLSENIRHHIKEEERDMLPKARHLDIDFTLLGKKMLTMKAQLKQNGFPKVDDEEKIVASSKGKADSSAKNAKITKMQAMKAPASKRKAAAKPTGKKANVLDMKKAKPKAKPAAKSVPAKKSTSKSRTHR